MGLLQYVLSLEAMERWSNMDLLVTRFGLSMIILLYCLPMIPLAKPMLTCCSNQPKMIWSFGHTGINIYSDETLWSSLDEIMMKSRIFIEHLANLLAWERILGHLIMSTCMHYGLTQDYLMPSLMNTSTENFLSYVNGLGNLFQFRVSS